MAINITLDSSYRNYKLTTCELMTYGYLNSFFENDKDVFVKQSKLAQELNYSLVQVKRARKSLVAKGLIVIMQNKGHRYYVPCMNLDKVKNYLQSRVASSFDFDKFIKNIQEKQKTCLKRQIKTVANIEPKKINASPSNLSTDARKEQKGTKVLPCNKNALKLIYGVFRDVYNNSQDSTLGAKFDACSFLEIFKEFDNPTDFAGLNRAFASYFDKHAQKTPEVYEEIFNFTVTAQVLAVFKAKDTQELFYFIDNGHKTGLYNEPVETIKKPRPFLFVFLWVPFLLYKFNNIKVNDLFTLFVENYRSDLPQSFNSFDEIVKYYIDLLGTHNGTAN